MSGEFILLVNGVKCHNGRGRGWLGGMHSSILAVRRLHYHTPDGGADESRKLISRPSDAHRPVTSPLSRDNNDTLALTDS